MTQRYDGTLSDWTFTITRPCPTCKGGSARPFHQWCPSCHRQYAPGELSNHESEILPCGHSAIMLCETNYCDDCEDAGIEQRVITLEEVISLAVTELEARS